MTDALPKMQYIRLGQSGLKLVLGCMSYGTKERMPWSLQEEESVEQLKVAYDAGINAFDTANVYSAGESERILGVFLKKYDIPRSSVVIMTKGFGLCGDEKDFGPAGGNNNQGLSRKHLFDTVRASLDRLQLEYIDLFQCHRFDKETPIAETMQALHDLVQAGLVRYIGMSSCWAYQFSQMQNYAINNKLTPFISMQNFHNAIYREEEREMMPAIQAFGVGCIPWSPLAAGNLSRPLADKQETARGDSQVKKKEWKPEELTDATKEIIRRVEKVASDVGRSMSQVALAWQMTKPFCSAPIIGTTSLDKLRDCIRSIDLKLTDEQVAFIDEPYQPRTVVGHN